MTVATTENGKHKPHYTLWNGKEIEFRWGQMFGWSVVAGFLFAAFVAGGYFLITQVHWYIHIGSFYWPGFSLKTRWDGLFHFKSWPLYRHVAFRDQLEPAAATMGVLTLMAKPKWWGRKVSDVRLVLSPLILLILAIGLSVAGVWLLNFALPQLSHIFPQPAKWYETAIMGVLIGRVLHRFWAPVGATLQGFQVDRAVDHARLKNRIPYWVRYPMVPPVLRERFSWMWTHDEKITQRSRGGRIAIRFVTVMCVLVTIVGVIAHYWIGKGHSFPYLTSK